jgi:hypothetical protein
MYKIPQPALSLNDTRTESIFPQWRTETITPTTTRRTVIERVVLAADRAPGGKITNVIVHCHGGPGFLQMGEGFHPHHAQLFSAWRGMVGKIWIHACRVASGKLGDEMCRAIARASACTLYASTYRQFNIIGRVGGPAHRYPQGVLDEFEGDVKHFGPDGSLIGIKHYAIGINANNE